MTLTNKYKGKRVKYVGDENEYTGEYFPLPGTLGTCTGGTDIAPNGKTLICVKWDKGTKGDGRWYCYDTDVEFVREEQ